MSDSLWVVFLDFCSEAGDSSTALCAITWSEAYPVAVLEDGIALGGRKPLNAGVSFEIVK